jgi:hypothetical protein
LNWSCSDTASFDENCRIPISINNISYDDADVVNFTRGHKCVGSQPHCHSFIFNLL